MQHEAARRRFGAYAVTFDGFGDVGFDFRGVSADVRVAHDADIVLMCPISRGLATAAALRGEECCLAVVFCGCQAHESLVGKLRFDDADYSIVVKSRAPPPNSWRWEIYRAGRSSPIGQSPIFFHTIAAANKAGKAALKQLLAKLNT